MGWASRYYLAADTETGNLTPQTGDLLRAGFALYDAAFNCKWEYEFAISMPVHLYRTYPEAMNVNKLNLEECSRFGLVDSRLKLETYKDCSEIHQDAQNQLFKMRKQLIELRKKSVEVVLMCHNVVFDKPFLSEWFPWLFELISYRNIDTIGCALMVQDAGKLPVENVKLVTLTEHFNIPHKAHSALADAQACMEVYRRLIELCKL